jgi:hypothetical protein
MFKAIFVALAVYAAFATSKWIQARSDVGDLTARLQRSPEAVDVKPVADSPGHELTDHEQAEYVLLALECSAAKEKIHQLEADLSMSKRLNARLERARDTAGQAKSSALKKYTDLVKEKRTWLQYSSNLETTCRRLESEVSRLEDQLARRRTPVTRRR